MPLDQEASLGKRSQRFFRRIDIGIGVAFEKLGNSKNEEFAAELIDLHYSGARLITKTHVQIGDRIRINASPQRYDPWLNVQAELKWCRELQKGKYEAGVEFFETSEETKAIIHYVLTHKFNANRTRGIIFWSLVMLAIGLPIILIVGPLMGGRPIVNLFNIFTATISLERIWETFLTSRINRSNFKETSDWTISAVVFYYIVMILGISTEHYFIERRLNASIMEFGILIFCIAFGMRWWGMKSLGKEWRIHVTEEDPVARNGSQIVRRGPYRLIRHPIYLGVILELISIPLIANAFWTLLFVALVNIPLQIFRSGFEEEYLFSKFPKDFVRYREETESFLPIPHSRRGHGSRRQKRFLIDFEDRRIKS